MYIIIMGALLAICNPLFGESSNLEMVQKMPQPFISPDYSCDRVVQVVNHLRHSGKDQAIKALEMDLKENASDNNKVVLICRLLFRNPSGWPLPLLGAPTPNIGAKNMDQFPIFPWAISRGVPFLIIQGYVLDGRGESAIKCLDLCRDLPMVPDDLADKNYEAAAQALIDSEEFKHIYPSIDSRFAMEKFVLNQARAKSGKP